MAVNKFRGRCVRCGAEIAAGKGRLTRADGRWLLTCLSPRTPLDRPIVHKDLPVPLAGLWLGSGDRSRVGQLKGYKATKTVRKTKRKSKW